MLKDCFESPRCANEVERARRIHTLASTMTPSVELIRGMLAGHACADASEHDSLRRIRALLEGPGDPFSRAHYEPGHLTASGIVVNPERTRTLLIFHAKLQRWLQPGGHFEPGECDPRLAAAREVLEETGLTARTAAEGPGTAGCGRPHDSRAKKRAGARTFRSPHFAARGARRRARGRCR